MSDHKNGQTGNNIAGREFPAFLHLKNNSVHHTPWLQSRETYAKIQLSKETPDQWHKSGILSHDKNLLTFSPEYGKL